jgi:hypothetical protein
METDPLLDERLDLTGKVSPCLRAPGLGEAREVHQQQDTPIDIACPVSLLVKPSDVTLNRFTEPAGPDPIDALWFAVVLFHHDNFLSGTS